MAFHNLSYSGTRTSPYGGIMVPCVSSCPASGYGRGGDDVVPEEHPCHKEWRDGVKARLEEQRAIARELLG
jgi:hypothetical protein